MYLFFLKFLYQKIQLLKFMIKILKETIDNKNNDVLIDIRIKD